MLGALHDVATGEKLDLETCSPQEIVFACINQDPKAVRLYSDLLSAKEEEQQTFGATLVLEIGRICGKEKLTQKPAADVRTVFIIAANKILNIQNSVKLTREKIREIVREAISVA